MLLVSTNVKVLFTTAFSCGQIPVMPKTKRFALASTLIPRDLRFDPEYQGLDLGYDLEVMWFW